MSRSPFVHLHNHTEYSLLDGINRIEPMMRKAVELGMPAVAITDHGNMFGAPEFYKCAKKFGIKPIIGCEIYLEPEPEPGGRRPSYSHHLILLAKSQKGYENLIQLVSDGYLNGFYYKPRVSKEKLAEHSGDLVCTTACLAGEVAWNVLRDKVEEAKAAIGFYQDIFGRQNFFLELMDHDMEEQRQANRMILELAQSLDVPLVATNDCHYLEKSDAHSHEVWLCVQTGRQLSSEKRLAYPTDEFYFKSGKEMWRRFGDFPEALHNTLAVAEMIDFEMIFGQTILPDFQTPGGESPEEYLRTLALEGLERRLAAASIEREGRKVYEDRLEYELRVITDMRYPAYFLITWDFIRHAKCRGVPVGPGRGSAAGSLVAYALGITDIDPVPYKLVFERFLNPERVSMPDIDIDFCKRRRDQVIDYVAKKYSRSNVAQIITFGTSKARNVLRDVGRVLGMPYSQVDKITKLIPDVLNIKLKEAIAQEPRLQELIDKEPEVRRLMEISFGLEGIVRHASVHAAGVVISKNPVGSYVPLYRDPKKGDVVTQYDMRILEEIGLLKMDFLGLKTLTVIDDTLKTLRSRGENPPDLKKLPLDDRATYALLSRADTNGVFQVESSGMKELLRELKPSVFEEIIALVALYRPGPLGSGMVKDFIDRKHGRKSISYPLPTLRDILKDTYGIILYQEQVMQIASKLAGFSLGQADLLRRAMGKKKKSVMEEQRQLFVEGSVLHGTSQRKATEIFDLMAKFAEYGFNKSHSAAYALLTYQTAYLKAHHPAAFFAAWLTNDVDNTDKVVIAIDDASQHGIELLPPDVNESDESFTVVGAQQIRFGLAGIKSVGHTAVEQILSARSKAGRFLSLYDLAQRVDLRTVNRRVFERLIKCGACSSFSENRAGLMEILDRVVDAAQRAQADRAAGQISLFGDQDEIVGADFPVPDMREYPKSSILEWEKEYLGFYLSGHPLDRFRPLLERLGDTDSVTIRNRAHRESIRIGGILRNIKQIVTRKNGKMARAILEDLKGSVPVTFFPKSYEKCRDLIREDSPVLLLGEAESMGSSANIVVDGIVPLTQVREEHARRIRIRIPENSPKSLFFSVRRILLDHPGSCPVFVELEVSGFGQLESVLFAPAKPSAARPVDSLFRQLEAVLGEDRVLTE